MKLLPNRSGDIEVTTDYFNLKTKGIAIWDFLESAGDALKGNNMIVLFGEWGSGKSTLMNFIKKELEVGKQYKTVFFTAWEHEKDDNLALSLVDAITCTLKKGESVKAFIKESAAFFINMFRGLTIKTPDILGFGFEYDFDKQQEAIDKYYEKVDQEGSFFKKIKDFKESFQKMENEILEENQKLIIFIDDLDRCEPENMLALLSSIKLFFSLGKRTIFFFGVDRDAVTNAVKTKYGEVIKSDEYLEKVFDISFGMPQSNNLKPLIGQYFSKDVEKIEDFLKTINFRTPRHVKKVFNKLEILRTMISAATHRQWGGLVPNIFNNETDNFLEIILTLFIIIIYEYYPDIFIELEDYEGKTIEYARNYYESLQPNNTFSQAISSITAKSGGYCFNSIEGIGITELVSQSEYIKGISTAGFNYRTFLRFLSLFTPKTIGRFNPSINGVSEIEFIKQFEGSKNNILYNFCEFLLQNKALVIETKSSYIYTNFFEMARTLL